jgi:quercetin dioxygenase-like cupin family protein
LDDFTTPPFQALGSGKVMRCRGGKHPTAHPREEFGFVIAGEVALTRGPETFTLGPGDSVTILRGELRRWANTGSTAALILLVAVL